MESSLTSVIEKHRNDELLIIWDDGFEATVTFFAKIASDISDIGTQEFVFLIRRGNTQHGLNVKKAGIRVSAAFPPLLIRNSEKQTIWKLPKNKIRKFKTSDLLVPFSNWEDEIFDPNNAIERLMVNSRCVEASIYLKSEDLDSAKKLSEKALFLKNSFHLNSGEKNDVLVRIASDIQSSAETLRKRYEKGIDPGFSITAALCRVFLKRIGADSPRAK